MRTGAGKAAAQKSAGRLSVCFEQYALIGFMLNESSMNAYIENSFQLDTQLPYLQARLEEQLRCWCDCLLFDFFDASWCAVLLNAGVSLLDCAEALVAFSLRNCTWRSMYALLSSSMAWKRSRTVSTSCSGSINTAFFGRRSDSGLWLQLRERGV